VYPLGTDDIEYSPGSCGIQGRTHSRSRKRCIAAKKCSIASIKIVKMQKHAGVPKVDVLENKGVVRGLDIMTGCNVGSVWNNVSRCRHMVGERTNWTRAYPECIFLNILKRSYASCLYQYLYNFRKFNYVVGRRINVELKRCFMQSNINIIIWIIVYVSCLLKKYRYINLILRMHDKNYINFYKYIKYKKLYNYIKNYTLKRIFW